MGFRLGCWMASNRCLTEPFLGPRHPIGLPPNSRVVAGRPEQAEKRPSLTSRIGTFFRTNAPTELAGPCCEGLANMPNKPSLPATLIVQNLLRPIWRVRLASPLEYSAYHGDAKLYDAFLAAARSAKDHAERRRLLSRLGYFRRPKLVERTLELVLSDEFDLRDTRTCFRNCDESSRVSVARLAIHH